MPTPQFGVAKTAAEARKVAESLDCQDLVVKAQVKTENWKVQTNHVINPTIKIPDTGQVMQLEYGIMLLTK